MWSQADPSEHWPWSSAALRYAMRKADACGHRSCMSASVVCSAHADLSYALEVLNELHAQSAGGLPPWLQKSRLPWACTTGRGSLGLWHDQVGSRKRVKHRGQPRDLRLGGRWRHPSIGLRQVPSGWSGCNRGSQAWRWRALMCAILVVGAHRWHWSTPQNSCRRPLWGMLQRL